MNLAVTIEIHQSNRTHSGVCIWMYASVRICVQHARDESNDYGYGFSFRCVNIFAKSHQTNNKTGDINLITKMPHYTVYSPPCSKIEF